MTEELPGDPAAPSGSRQDGRAAAGVSPLRASIPIAALEAAIEALDAAEPLLLTHTDGSAWPACCYALKLLQDARLAQGIEAEWSRPGTGLDAKHESPVASAMRPDDPATRSRDAPIALLEPKRSE